VAEVNITVDDFYFSGRGRGAACPRELSGGGRSALGPIDIRWTDLATDLPGEA